MCWARRLSAVLLWALLAWAGASSASPVSRGASLDAPGPDGETPLTAAVRHSRLDLLKSLLAQGADPNVGGGEGNKPPLLIAIDLGNADMVQALLDAKAGVKGFLVDATPNVKIMALLVAAGAPVNPPNSQEWSPLDSAVCDHRDRTAFDFLLAHGAEIKPGTYSANKALTRAVDMGNLSIAETLLDRGVGPNFPHASFTDLPLDRAILQVDFPDTTLPMIELLLKHGAAVNLRDDVGTPPLDWIAGGGPPSRPTLRIVTLLLDHGADVNAANVLRVTPLLWAAGSHEVEIVRVLLQHGADVRAHDSQGNTALNQAAYFDFRPSGPASAPTLELLAARGADVRGRDGGRALICAAATRNDAGAAALLNLGAPPHDYLLGAFAPTKSDTVYFIPFVVPDEKPMRLTALGCAIANGDASLVRLLRAHGARPYRHSGTRSRRRHRR